MKCIYKRWGARTDAPKRWEGLLKVISFEVSAEGVGTVAGAQSGNKKFRENANQVTSISGCRIEILHLMRYRSLRRHWHVILPCRFSKMSAMHRPKSNYSLWKLTKKTATLKFHFRFPRWRLRRHRHAILCRFTTFHQNRTISHRVMMS